MSTSGLRAGLIYIFNLLNLLCFSLHKSEIHISKVLVVKNLLMLPCIHGLRSLVYLTGCTTSQKDPAFRPGITWFNLIAYGSMQIIHFFMLAFYMLYQLWNSKKLLKLAKKNVKFYQRYKLGEKKHVNVHEGNLYERLSAFTVIILLLYVWEFAITYSLDWQGFILMLLNPSNGFYLLFVFGLIHCLLSYIECIFTNLRLQINDLKNLKRSEWPFGRILNYLIDSQELLAEFQSTMGFLLSLVLLQISTTLTIRVRVINFNRNSFCS